MPSAIASKAERSQMEAEYSNTLRACYQKLNVNACKDDAFKTRLQKSNVLKAQERVLNDQETQATQRCRIAKHRR
jgi:hypothetical protein